MLTADAPNLIRCHLLRSSNGRCQCMLLNVITFQLDNNISFDSGIVFAAGRTQSLHLKFASIGCFFFVTLVYQNTINFRGSEKSVFYQCTFVT